MKKIKLPSLHTCILLDLVGMSSYLLPFAGEVFDFIWAPLSAIIFYFMFGKKAGVFGGMFSFIEELLPGFDIIPTFTIAWFIRKRKLSAERSLSHKQTAVA